MHPLATNPLGRAMHASLYERAPGPVSNFARYTFLDDDSQRLYPHWDTAADTCVAILRTEAGRRPHDPLIPGLVGELAFRSDDFGHRWSTHHVRLNAAGTKSFHHTAVGNLELAYESVETLSEPGLTLTIYAAEPASRTADALSLLASLTAPEPTPRDAALHVRNGPHDRSTLTTGVVHALTQ